MPITGPDRGCLDAAAVWPGTPLETPRLRLARPKAGDMDALVELAGDSDVSRWTAFVPHPYTADDARAFIEKSERDLAAGKGVVLTVERRQQPGLIGCIGVAIDGDAGDVGYWIGRPFWGHGFAREAVQAVTGLAFRYFPLARVGAEVMADNPASARVLEKAGYAFLGDDTGCRGRCKGKPVRAYALTRQGWAAAEAKKPMVLVVAAALVDADGRVLIAKRPEGKSMAGLWEFPGGKVGAGERPETALIRELKEELGIDITESCVAPIAFASHAYADFHLLMPLYVCRVWKGTPKPREGQEIKWVRPLGLADYAMPPADAPLVAMLRDLL
jgi:8-oxo-dGTP diphosphatase